jgi:peroxiredoxin Q/BCP
MLKPFHKIGLLVMAVSLTAAVWASETVMEAPKDFTLKSVDGKHEFKLSEAKTEYVALHFLLKTECPICLRYTAEYAAHAKDQPNVTHIFIKPDEPAETMKWMANIDETNATAPVIYHDKDAKLADQYGIKNGYEFHGEVVHYPAFILTGKTGKVYFTYVGESNRDRFDYKELNEKLKELKS